MFNHSAAFFLKVPREGRGLELWAHAFGEIYWSAHFLQHSLHDILRRDVQQANGIYEH